jgi:chromosome segregation ATPase
VEADALAARTLAASLEIQLAASQQQVKDLSIRLAESQTQLMTAQTDLKETQRAADERQELGDALKKAEGIVAEQSHTIATLKRDLAIAETTVARLDDERTKGLKEQVEWQKRCRELETECDRHQTVLADLDQHNAEMQEEIFQQTRQVGEYEAAIQFWKERYLSSQRQLNQLKQLLEREAPHLSENAAEDLLQAVKLAMQPEEESPATLAAVPSPQLNTVDMPEFLIRRYAFRNRSLFNRELSRGMLDESDNPVSTDAPS